MKATSPLAKRKRSDDASDGGTADVGRAAPSLPTSTATDRVPRDAPSQRKWTRLLLRELYDLGFREAAACLEREAGVRVRSRAMETLQTLILQHRWDDALAYLQQQPSRNEPVKADNSNDADADADAATLPLDVPQMKSRAAAKEVALLLLKRKYVELLLQKQLRGALETFQQQILPHFEMSEGETQELAVLLLCTDQRQMETLVDMPLKDEDLLGRIEALVSPDEVVPHGRLRQMVQWEDNTAPVAVSFAKAESVDVECVSLLLKHTHEVIDLAFSPDGKYLASVAQDGKIIIWELVFTEEENLKTGNVTTGVATSMIQTLQCIEGAPTCIAWSPDSRALLSGGGEDSNVIQLWNPLTGRRGRRFQHPAESVVSLCWLPDGNRFLSGSVEKSLVLWNVEDASVAYQWGGRRALDIVVHSKGDQAFVLCSETELRVYNLVDKSDRLLLRADHLISTISVSPAADYMLLSFIEHEEIACFDIANDTIISRQRGFKQERYVLRPCFAGADNELVVSGSEDGSLHVWLRDDGKAVGEASGHSSVVNVVVVHPLRRNVIASASDDETIRLWRIAA